MKAHNNMICSNVRKQVFKRTTGILIILLLLTSIFTKGFAYSPNTPKEEVVYVNLNLDGSLNEIFVVNSFDLDKDGRIIDYGDYTAFRQLSSSARINMENEMITIDGEAGKLYYEGTLKKTSLPWLFNIRYFVDGKEYDGEETAGMSGSLEILMSIRENKEANAHFFEHMTLQVAFTMNGDLCRNIRGEGATIVNAGQNKQILFTILPKKEKDIRILADVTDFEMEGISINGIPMNMDFSFEEDAEMTAKLNELKDGIAKLDDGAIKLRDNVGKFTDATKELKEGSLDIKDGTLELADGTEKIKNGVKDLNDGIFDLNDGVKKMSKGTKELKDGTWDLNDGTKKMYTGAKKLYNGAETLNRGLGLLSSQNTAIMNGAGQIFDLMLEEASSKLGTPLTRHNYKTALDGLLEGIGGFALQKAMEQAEAEITEAVIARTFEELKMQKPNATDDEIYQIMDNEPVKSQISAAVSQQLSELEDQIMQSIQGELTSNPEYIALMTLRQQLSGFEDFFNALHAYTSGVAEAASGATDLISGMDKWQKGMNDLKNGTTELKDSVIKLHDGILVIKDGTTKILDGSTELEDGIIELNDGMIQLKDGVIELFDGAIELHEGSLQLYDGTITMAEGTFEFRDKTSNMEKDIKNMIRDKIDEMLGKGFIPLSFVSDKNTRIESIQFVMKTKAIGGQDDGSGSDSDNKNKETTLLQKIRNLFTRSKG
ncbi:MAG: hypothetical protein ACOX4U_03595 [Anaerovoracaceae bacterium]|jgi:putative membrane protein